MTGGERFDEIKGWFRHLPLDDIEYNGHFGPNFFFRLTGEDETTLDTQAQEVLSILERELKP